MSSGNDFVIHQSPPPPGDPHDSATPHHRPPPPPVLPPTVKSHYTMMQMEGQHVAFPMILPVVVVLFFLTTVYTIYLLRDLLQYFTATWVLRRSPNNTPPAQPPDTRPSGLDPSILASFPIFPYNSVRGLRNGKSELECAVCLSEFSDGDSLRLLTVCSHAFHPECIDLWLSSHTTCPVCRSNLDKPPQEGFVLSLQDSGEESHRISVKEEDGVVGEGSAGAENSRQTEQFPKSHSTGHSLVMERRRRTDDEESDRYTLRLQYNGEEKHMLHSRIVSCITFREGSGDAAAARGAAAGSSGG